MDDSKPVGPESKPRGSPEHGPPRHGISAHRVHRFGAYCRRDLAVILLLALWGVGTWTS
jgi:hypothetical protein